MQKFTKLTPEQQAAKETAYKDIKLSFGKYKGKTLEEIVDLDSDYLVWLCKSMKADQSEKSPTQRAILKYINKQLF